MYNIYINNTLRKRMNSYVFQLVSLIMNSRWRLEKRVKLVNRLIVSLNIAALLIYRKAAGNVDDYVYNM